MSALLAQLRGVTKRFGDTLALNEVDLDLSTGQVTALVGESGSGKSTVLRLLMGLTRPDRGELSLFGEAIAVDRSFDDLRRRMGYVIQGGGLFPHLSAADNASMAAHAFGWGGQKRQRRLDELSRLTQLEPGLLKRLPRELSGGQRQRVALMRALFLDPDLLLLDEPLGALDPVIRSELQDQLQQLFASLGKTVLLVTHDLPEAAFFSQDLVLMHQSRVVQRGTFERLRSQPGNDYVRRFVAATRELPR